MNRAIRTLSQPEAIRSLSPICETLRDLRLDRGRTQTHLAAALGVAQPELSRFESGGRVPALDFTERWAAELDLVLVLAPRTDA